MNKLNNTDSLDEALRVIYLETAKELGDTDSTKQMELILASKGLEMNQEKYNLLMKKLSSIATELSFGQLLQLTFDNTATNDDLIAEKVHLPVNVIADLKKDAIYTNNVPIVLFKNLLTTLNITYKSAEKAIRKTFDMLQSQASIKGTGGSGFSPAFRKGFYTSRESFNKNSPKGDGKELFENKESLEKYLSRLSELMN